MNAFLIGVDEVGRGPLAGPVSVGVVLVPNDFDWALIPGVTDSKKLTEKKRETIYEIAGALRQEGRLVFAVASESAASIDARGIVGAIKVCMERALALVMASEMVGNSAPQQVRVLLDGGLRAPVDFLNQETIIKGDAKESVIGLASIIAKVTRDRELVRLDTVYPGYGLSVHKGYGTALHRRAIAMLGMTPLHRLSFCRSISPLSSGIGAVEN